MDWTTQSQYIENSEIYAKFRENFPGTWNFNEDDFPFTLYFQDRVMPKWSNWWIYPSDYNDNIEPLGHDVEWCVKSVISGMQHCCCLNSEESPIFIIAAQRVLLELVRDVPSFEESYHQLASVTRISESLADVYNGVISGLIEMIKIAEQADVVFYSSGYPEDQKVVIEAMRRFSLGDGHLDYLLPLHRAVRQRSDLMCVNRQRKELSTISSSLLSEDNSSSISALVNCQL